MDGAPDLELMAPAGLSIVCFRYVPERPTADDAVDAINAEIVHRLHVATPYIPSTTKVHGVLAIRPCFVNSRTTDATLDGFTATVVALGEVRLVSWPLVRSYAFQKQNKKYTLREKN